MKIFGKVENNTNASFFKRFLSFFIDYSVSSILKLFILQFVFINYSKSVFITFVNNFNRIFPNLKINEIKNVHIRYMASSQAYMEMLKLLVILFILTILYKLISYIIFKRTLGQKLTGLLVVNNKDDKIKKMNFIQAIFRSILESVPGTVTFILAFFIPFNIFKFHLNTISEYVLPNFFTSIIEYSTLTNFVTFVLIYILFWFNMFFFSNKFFLHDILTKTRVVDKNFIDNGENIEKAIVGKVDNLLDKLTQFNKKCINLIKNSLTTVFKKCRKS